MTQCRARAKSTGEQCRCAAILGGTVCWKHGGAAPQVRAKATERLLIARDLSCERLTQKLQQDVVEPRELVAATRDLTRTVIELEQHEQSHAATSVVDQWLESLKESE